MLPLGPGPQNLTPNGESLFPGPSALWGNFWAGEVCGPGSIYFLKWQAVLVSGFMDGKGESSLGLFAAKSSLYLGELVKPFNGCGWDSCHITPSPR